MASCNGLASSSLVLKSHRQGLLPTAAGKRKRRSEYLAMLHEGKCVQRKSIEENVHKMEQRGDYLLRWQVPKNGMTMEAEK